MDYIRIKLDRGPWAPYRLSDEHRYERNPYELPEAGDNLFGEAWTTWFHSVDAVDPQRLKSKVPVSFHALIDGRIACPDCGAPLGYRPADDRWHMVEVCPSCGYRCHVCDAVYAEQADKRYRWLRAHHLPTCRSEYWILRAINSQRDALETGAAAGDDSGAVPASWSGVVLAPGVAVDIETGTVYPKDMGRDEAIRLAG